MVDLLPIADLKGPPGYNATDAAEDAAALAAFVNEDAGPNDFSNSLKANFLKSESLLSYAENRTNQITLAPYAGSNWGNIVGLMLHVPPTTRDVLLFWSGEVGVGTAGQGKIALAPWDITRASTDLNIFVDGGMTWTECSTADPVEQYTDHQHGFSNIGAKATHRMYMLACKTTQKGSSLYGYINNGVLGYDHTWMMAVMQ